MTVPWLPFTAGTVSADLKGLRRAFEALEFDEDPESEYSDESDQESDGGEASDIDRASDKPSGQAGQDGGDPSDPEDSSNEDEASEQTLPTSPQKRKPQPAGSPQMDVDMDDEKKAKKRLKSTKRAYRDQISSYYGQGTGYGTPVAGLVYQLACLLGRGSNDFLWYPHGTHCRYTILSATNNYIYGQSSTLEYTTLAKEYKDEVDRLSTTPHALGADEGPLLTTTTTGAGQKKSESNAIRFIEDFQLVLLRHWNLYDSLFHSTYVATKLGVWKEQGRQRLTNLLVKMGFPQKESRQYYREMDIAYKKVLGTKLVDLAPKYNLPDIVFPSFDKTYGYITTLSASDVVYAVTALLDCGATLLGTKGVSGFESMLNAGSLSSSHLLQSNKAKHAFQDISEAGDGGLVGAGVGTKTVSASIASQVFDQVAKSDHDSRPDWVRHFYIAYDALASPQLLQHGILLAIHYQRLLVQTAMSVLEKRLVKSLKHFQLAILKGSGSSEVNGDAGESRIFGDSIPMLYRLTSFLMEAYQVHKDRKLPFVCVAANEANSTYLVLGRAVHSARKNPFGLAFLEAASRTEVEIQHDFFDSSCIRVHKDDLEEFLENLQLTMV
ncbi:hypothetical protein HDV03_004451 [Kappamyces sp. JEL0829]|nr:hypothetical protein HDV03_004451 [Kappamyces sp. JEL0829]